MRKLTNSIELADIASGAAILASGGGGDPYIGLLLACHALETGNPVTLVSLSEVPDDAVVVTIACLGAPTILREKIPSGQEAIAAFRGLESYLGKKITHILPVEAGGLNSLIPVIVSAQLNLPMVDADFMGRAFPELQMVLPTLEGIGATPMAISDEKGNTAVLNTATNEWGEKFARAISVEMGAMSFIASYSMTGAQLQRCSVGDSLSLSQEIGKRLRNSVNSDERPVDIILQILQGSLIIHARVVDVDRRIEGGFVTITCVLQGLGSESDREIKVYAQNEYLLAEEGNTYLCSTPDLLIIVESETASPVTAEEIRYGMRVSLIAAPCDPRWRTPEGLALVGPKKFGHNIDYIPIEKLARV